MLVVTTMFAGPHEGRVLKGPGAKEKREEANGPVRAERPMGEEPMITECDAHAREGEQHEEQHHLKPVQAELPNVQRDGGDREQESSDQEGARLPVDYAIGR